LYIMFSVIVSILASLSSFALIGVIFSSIVAGPIRFGLAYSYLSISSREKLSYWISSWLLKK